MTLYYDCIAFGIAAMMLARIPITGTESGRARGNIWIAIVYLLQTALCNAASEGCTAWNGVNLGTGSIKEMATPDSTACCQACRAEQRCVAWTFAIPDRHCFLKDNLRSNHTENNRISGVVAGAPSPSPAPVVSWKVEVHINTTVRWERQISDFTACFVVNCKNALKQIDRIITSRCFATQASLSSIDKRFLGVNADWWLDGCGGEGKKWSSNASMALLDLQNRCVIHAAS